MAYVITALCEHAGLCVDVCPTDSIHFVEDDPKWPTYYINPDSCISCGACAAECPNDAIFDEGDADDKVIKANAAFYTSGPGKKFVEKKK